MLQQPRLACLIEKEPAARLHGKRLEGMVQVLVDTLRKMPATEEGLLGESSKGKGQKNENR